MQSKDGGWGAFDADNTRALADKLPFCDFGEVIDPPSADVTAHVVEMLAAEGWRTTERAPGAASPGCCAEQEAGRLLVRPLGRQLRLRHRGRRSRRWSRAGVPPRGAGDPPGRALAGGLPERRRRLGRGPALLHRPGAGSAAAPRPPRRPPGRCWRCSRRGSARPGRRARGRAGWPAPSARTAPGTSRSSPAPASPATSPSTTTSTGWSSRSPRSGGYVRGTMALTGHLMPDQLVVGTPLLAEYGRCALRLGARRARGPPADGPTAGGRRRARTRVLRTGMGPARRRAGAARPRPVGRPVRRSSREPAPAAPPRPSSPGVAGADPGAVPRRRGRRGEVLGDGDRRRSPDAAGLARALRAAGVSVHVGPVLRHDHVVRGATARPAARRPAARRGRHGVRRARRACARPPVRQFAVVRVVVDTPRTPAGALRHRAERRARIARAGPGRGCAVGLGRGIVSEPTCPRADAMAATSRDCPSRRER